MCELHYMACKKKKDKPSMKITTTKYKKLKIKITTAENWVCDITQKSGFAVGSERRQDFDSEEEEERISSSSSSSSRA